MMKILAQATSIFLLNFLCAFFILLPGKAFAAMDEYPVAKLQTLDKVSARTMVFNVKVGTTVKFGNVFIRVQTCRKAPPIEAPESAAFLQIWETTVKEQKPQWIFSGWMFASSPALSPMDHPVYDVWVLDCLEGSGAGVTAEGSVPPAPKKAAERERTESEEKTGIVETVTDSEAEADEGGTVAEDADGTGAAGQQEQPKSQDDTVPSSKTEGGTNTAPATR